MEIVFEGNTRFDNSYGIVNLNLAGALRERGHRVVVNSWDETPDEYAKSCEALGCDPFPSRPPQEHDVCIRQFWPPEWERPNVREFIMMQPWEFGGVPRSWVDALDNVDQVWAYSQFVKSCWVEGGADPAKIHVVPLGVRPAPTLDIATRPGQLLFLGGGIWRKGADLFIEAVNGLSDSELSKVQVVIKESGNDSFYRGQSLVDESLSTFPRVSAITTLQRQSLSRYDLDCLIAQSHALVHPYRAEGFYLGGLEAMSLGTSVIMTRGGAGDEYANDTNARMIDAVTTIGEGELTLLQGPIGGEFHWLEASTDELTNAIRDLLASSPDDEDRIEAGRDTSTRFSWANSAQRAEQAIISALTGDNNLDDHFALTDLAISRFFSTWAIGDLDNAISVLLGHQDMHGARELLAACPGELPANAIALCHSLDNLIPNRVDLWRDAWYRLRIASESLKTSGQDASVVQQYTSNGSSRD